jgi:CDP-diacylglycerol--glycerol-3-phosphate 3-phosphatidyltransferase
MIAALVLAVAIATDLLDGPLARRRGTVTMRGRLFDHTADCVFVTSGLTGGAIRGVFPWILPVLVAAAFVQYVLDSYWIGRGGALRTSALGRYNGILYFAPLGGDILVRAGLDGLERAVVVLVWLLVASTLVSMAERFWAVTRRRERARGSPGAEREDPPPR